jgi:hypoxanthine phosphoribosyltransferase
MVTLREVYTPAAIAARVAAVGKAITTDYTGKEVVLVAMLKGATVLLADLVRAIEGPVRFELVNVTRKSEGNGEAIDLTYATHVNLAGTNALILKDICHSGITENYLATHLTQQGPVSIDVIALVDRPKMRRVAVEPRYVVLPDVPDGRLVGYGMEYQGRWGNLPGIHLLEGA